MRNQSVCLVLVIVLLCPFASAQWVQMNSAIASGGWGIDALVVRGAELFVGASVLDRDIGNESCLFHSTDNGQSWVAQSTFGATSIAINGADIYVGTRRGGVFVSANAGTNWTSVSSGLPRAGWDTTEYASVYSIVSSGQYIFAGTENSGVFLSTNRGTNWGQSGLANESVMSLALVGRNLFAGTGWSGVFLSTNNGTSWTPVDSGLTDMYVRCLAVSGTNVFAGTNSIICISTNSGISWIKVNSGLSEQTFWALGAYGTNLFAAGTVDGVVISTDNGNSWKSVNSGLNGWSNDVSAFGMNSTYVFAGTEHGNLMGGRIGAWLWRRPLSEMSTSMGTTLAELPIQFSLEQNYPNPLNPSTTIKYELPKSSVVELSVYDLLGREVSVLVNEKRDAGVHEVRFDGSGLSSGVYFYRLRAGDHVATKKLLLLK